MCSFCLPGSQTCSRADYRTFQFIAKISSRTFLCKRNPTFNSMFVFFFTVIQHLAYCFFQHPYNIIQLCTYVIMPVCTGPIVWTVIKKWINELMKKYQTSVFLFSMGSFLSYSSLIFGSKLSCGTFFFVSVETKTNQNIKLV